MENQDKINRLIDCLETSRKIEPSSEFLLKMENIALRYSTVIEKVSLRALMGIAATFLVLIMVNLMIITKSNNQISEPTIDNTATSYDLIPTKSYYYE